MRANHLKSFVSSCPRRRHGCMRNENPRFAGKGTGREIFMGNCCVKGGGIAHDRLDPSQIAGSGLDARGASTATTATVVHNPTSDNPKRTAVPAPTVPDTPEPIVPDASEPILPDVPEPTVPDTPGPMASEALEPIVSHAPEPIVPATMESKVPEATASGPLLPLGTCDDSSPHAAV